MFSKLFVYVAQRLNVQLPEVYLVERQQGRRHPARERDREERAVPVVRRAPAPAAGQDRARDRVPGGAPAGVHAARVLPEHAAADEHRAQGRAAVRDRDGAAALPGAAEHGRHGPAVPAQDAEAHAAARARAARRARPAVHPSGAGDRHGEVGPRGRCGVAPCRLRDVRRPRGLRAHGRRRAGRRRRPAP